MLRLWPLLVAIGSLLAAEADYDSEFATEAMTFLTDGIVSDSKSQDAVEAHDLVNKEDLEGIKEYTSTHELADAAADFLFKYYPQLDPMHEEDRILLKMQLSWMLATPDSKARKGVMERFPKYFKPFNTRVALFRKILKDQFAAISEEEKRMLQVETEEELVENLFKGPFVIHLTKKIAIYNKRGLNSERRKKEIRKKELALADQWDKVVQKEYQPFLFHHLWKKEQKTGQRIYVYMEDDDIFPDMNNPEEGAQFSRNEKPSSTKKKEEKEKRPTRHSPAENDEIFPDTAEQLEEPTNAIKLARTGPAPWYYKWKEWQSARPGRESIVNEAWDLVSSQDLQGMLNYTSLHELADVIVESTRKEYPAIDPHDDKTLTLIKLQVAWMLSIELEESYEVVKRFHFIFAPFTRAFSQLIDITEHEITQFPEEIRKGLPEEPNDYLKLTLYVPVYLHLAQKLVEYKEQGWSREEIKEVIREKELELAQQWRSWIEEREDPEVLHTKWKKEKAKKMERIGKDHEKKKKWNEEL